MMGGRDCGILPGERRIQTTVGTKFSYIAAIILVPALAWSGPARSAQEDAPAAATSAIPAAARPDDDPEPDKCDQEPLVDKVPEKVQSGLFEFSCRTVRWIDSLFGSSREFREESVQGRMTYGFSWNQYEHWDPTLRFRVRMDLPNLSNRWNAFLGRVDEEDYIAGSEVTEKTAFRRGISDDLNTEWLLGLGYGKRDEDTSGWDHSVGIRLRTPPRLYVRTRYEKVWQFGDSQDLRYRQTFFWRDGSTGFGTTTHFDSAREMGAGDILRWEFIGKVTEATDGMEWWIGNTWYHRLAERRGTSLRTFVRGATGREVELVEYGFELVWRRQVARDWLYINAGPTLTWPRLFPHERRAASWGVQALMEIEFGYFRD
jgi:hypothetical protein